MNILLTSAGRRTYLVKYFQEALVGNGLVHAGNSFYSAALQAADKAIITPSIYDSSYIDFLIDYCKKNNITAILSFFDVDLPILAKAKNRFKEDGISVVVSDSVVIHICNDKWETYKFLIDHRFNTPISFINIHNVKNALTKKNIKFPLILKPRWGMGSIGVYEVENLKELEILYSRCKKDVFKSYLSYESEQDPENCIIIQEKKTGEEFCMEVINDLQSQYITTFVKRKKDMRGGEDQNAVTEKNPLLESTGMKISQILKHVANLDVDCFICDGVPYIIEMNARFGGHYPFSHLAGANLPLAIIKWLKHEPVEKKLLEINYGVEGFKDINPIIINKNNLTKG
jgi:carbamoyl-phosphate synthase large subunit